jgi:hypothetical protein
MQNDNNNITTIIGYDDINGIILYSGRKQHNKEKKKKKNTIYY